jgi:peptidoglycan/LPS O-acetylase OafA/YrhL
MYALLFGSMRLKWPFELPVLRWVGLISFSLYMWHLPFLFLYMNAVLPHFQGWGGMIKYVGLMAWIMFLIIPISLTLYRWIEMPGMRLGEALIQRSEKLKKASPVDVPSDTPAEKAATDSLVEVPS